MGTVGISAFMPNPPHRSGRNGLEPVHRKIPPHCGGARKAGLGDCRRFRDTQTSEEGNPRLTRCVCGENRFSGVLIWFWVWVPASWDKKITHHPTKARLRKALNSNVGIFLQNYRALLIASKRPCLLPTSHHNKVSLYPQHSL